MPQVPALFFILRLLLCLGIRMPGPRHPKISPGRLPPSEEARGHPTSVAARNKYLKSFLDLLKNPRNTSFVQTNP